MFYSNRISESCECILELVTSFQQLVQSAPKTELSGGYGKNILIFVSTNITFFYKLKKDLHKIRCSFINFLFRKYNCNNPICKGIGFCHSENELVYVKKMFVKELSIELL